MEGFALGNGEIVALTNYGYLTIPVTLGSSKKHFSFVAN